jgi:hypothetical protein
MKVGSTSYVIIHVLVVERASWSPLTNIIFNFILKKLTSHMKEGPNCVLIYVLRVMIRVNLNENSERSV